MLNITFPDLPFVFSYIPYIYDVLLVSDHTLACKDNGDVGSI
jgi:hypothetical protein